MKVYTGLEELVTAHDTDLGTSSWLTIDQLRIDAFADATGDHQWIHVDPERAANGPFGRTIAHGFLTLSVLPVLMRELYRVEGVAMAVNYGLDKVRFISPVLCDARIRLNLRIGQVNNTAKGVQLTFIATIEVEGTDKPAAVVESIVRYFA